MIGKVSSQGLDLAPLRAELSKRTDAARNLYVDAGQIVTALLGNSVTANVFTVGVAYQAGFIPLPGEAIERAIELNGTAVEANLVGVPLGSTLGGRSRRRSSRRLVPASPTSSSRTRSTASTTPRCVSSSSAAPATSSPTRTLRTQPDTSTWSPRHTRPRRRPVATGRSPRWSPASCTT